MSTDSQLPRYLDQPKGWHDDYESLRYTANKLVWWLEKLHCTDAKLVAQAYAIEARILEILSKEYDHWRDDDSPKGETVPGVRFRR